MLIIFAISIKIYLVKLHVVEKFNIYSIHTCVYMYIHTLTFSLNAVNISKGDDIHYQYLF